MKRARLGLLVLAGSLAIGQVVRADGWSLSNLVPFASKSKSKTTYSSRRSKSKESSALDQIGKGTKKVVGTTTDIVTLKWLAPKKEPPKKQYQWRADQQAGQRPKKSWFDGLFVPAPEPEKPKTLTDWMAQKRLDP
jgi:hypothetical protein